MAANVEYRGGIPELRKTGITTADAFPDCLVVTQPGFSFKTFKIPYGKMIDVSFVPEGAKKKNYVLNVEYETADGFNTVAVLTGKEASKLYAELQKRRQIYIQRNPGAVKTIAEEPAAAPTDAAAELEKYHALMEKGVITEDDFNAKKAQLLGL